MSTERLAIVAGSGLDLLPLLDEPGPRHPFSAWGELPVSSVPGHEPVFAEGRCAGRPVVVQCGRLHTYEGLPFDTVVRTVDVLHDLGASAVLFTNAAGGLLPQMRPGDLVAADVLYPWRCTRLVLPELLRADFMLPGCDFTGAYAWMHGPCYETRAEIRALRSLGISTVGMSTAPEFMRCGHLGLAAAAVSCVTNNCTRPQLLTHTHVVQTAQRASARLCSVIRAGLAGLPPQRAADSTG